MICTEEEAKKKWCPKYQVSFAGSDCQDNRGLFPGYYCIASNCMMWRWTEPKIIQVDRGYGQPPDEDAIIEVDGFCGLGVKP